MRINADLSVRTLVHADACDWVPSPAAGVERCMLYRVGAEKARATSIVRFAPGSSFARHSHPGGEEFLVLEGTFQDETGDSPAGTYVRNPPGTGHAPGSAEGCTIFVRLWQFRPDDRAYVECGPGEGASAPLRPGAVSATLLYADTHEQVCLERWQPGAEVVLPAPLPLELLVLDGSLVEGGETLRRWSWLRVPAGEAVHAQVGPAGAHIFWKAATVPEGAAPTDDFSPLTSVRP